MPGYLKIFRRKIAIILIMVTLITIIYCPSCKIDKSLDEEAYGFVENFDRRVFLNFRSGINEYDVAKDNARLGNAAWGDKRLEYYSDALNHFQNSRSFFERASMNSSNMEALDETTGEAIEEFMVASGIYMESVKIYIGAVKRISEDPEYDFYNAVQQTHTLEYRAEKKILDVHLNIRDFEKKYPDIFTEDWQIKLDEVIQEQEDKITKIREEYGVNN